MADGSDNHEDSRPVVAVGSQHLTGLRSAFEKLDPVNPENIRHVEQVNVASAAINTPDILTQLRKQLGEQQLESAYKKDTDLHAIPKEEKLTSPETDGVVKAKDRELEPSV